MRMILGLDAPTARPRPPSAAAPTPTHRAPLHEVGALLEARSVHPGRTAFHHLIALAHTHGIPRSRVDEVLDLAGLHRGRRQAGQGLLPRHGPAPRHRRRAARRPGHGHPRRTGQRPRPRGRPLDPQPPQVPRRRGPDGPRLLAPDERDGADRRAPHHHRPRPAPRRHHGRRRSSANRARGSVKVVTPEADHARPAARRPRTCDDHQLARPGDLDVRGTDGEHIGRTAAAHGIPLYELDPARRLVGGRRSWT